MIKNFLSKPCLTSESIYFLISCFCGAITGSSAPGINLWFFAWIGFIPLLLIIFLEKSYYKTAIYSFGFGFFYHIVALYWFAGLFPLHWMGLNTVESILVVLAVLLIIGIYLSLYVTAFGLSALYLSRFKYLNTFLIPLSWIFFINILTSLGPFAFPWDVIEHSQYQILTFIQIAQFIGGIGLGYIIILFNTACSLLLYHYIEETKENQTSSHKPLNIYAGILSAIIILLMLINYYGFTIISKEEKGHISACVTQAAFPVELFRTGKVTTDIEFKTYLELIMKCPDGLIVVPEGAISTYLRDNTNSHLLKTLKDIAFMKKSHLIIGTYDQNEQGRTNSIIVIDPTYPETRLIPSYHKMFLVPYGEYTPFRKIIPDPLKDFLSISSTKDFAPGKKLKPLKSKLGKIGALVCYEAIFPNMSRKLTLDGSNVIVNASNLGWYHSSFIDKQFIAMCVLRAIENQRYFIVAINNGESAIINPQGKILARTQKNKKGFVSAKIQLKKNLTPYTQWGI